MPMEKHRYPLNWKEISAFIRHVRAQDQCEWRDEGGVRCTRKHGEPIPGNETKKTVLTTMHLNHDPADNRPENLRAACQMHHLRYDAAHHAKNAAQTRRQKHAGQSSSCSQ
jgi:hypothetical protein